MYSMRDWHQGWAEGRRLGGAKRRTIGRSRPGRAARPGTRRREPDTIVVFCQDSSSRARWAWPAVLFKTSHPLRLDANANTPFDLHKLDSEGTSSKRGLCLQYDSKWASQARTTLTRPSYHPLFSPSPGKHKFLCVSQPQIWSQFNCCVANRCVKV